MVSGMNLIEPLDCNDIIVGGMLHHHIRKKTHIIRPIGAQTHGTCLDAVVEIKWS